MSAWPSCETPDATFGKALLLNGPIPSSGWSVTRNAAGRAIYIYPRGREARLFIRAVEMDFADEIQRVYGYRGWKRHHVQQVAKKWKNEFLMWVDQEEPEVWAKKL